MTCDHPAGLEYDDVDNCLCVPLHIVRLDTLLDLKGFHSIVSLNDEEAGLLNDLNAVDPLVRQLLADEFVLSVDVNDVDVATLIACIELLILVVPAEARENNFVRVVQLVVRLTLTFRCLKPFERLIVADREDEVLRVDKEHLNHANPMNQVLLGLQSEQTVFLLSPSLKCLKDVQRAFRVTSKDL